MPPRGGGRGASVDRPPSSAGANADDIELGDRPFAAPLGTSLDDSFVTPSPAKTDMFGDAVPTFKSPLVSEAPGAPEKDGARAPQKQRPPSFKQRSSSFAEIMKKPSLVRQRTSIRESQRDNAAKTRKKTTHPCLSVFLDHWAVQGVLALALAVTLFLPDMWVLFNPSNDMDIYLNAVLIFFFFVFALEIVIT